MAATEDSSGREERWTYSSALARCKVFFLRSI
jgi:hypothetical protein